MIVPTNPRSWTPAAVPADFVLGHVRAVLTDQVLDDALVAVRAGRIEAVQPHRRGVRADLDGGNLLCVPGLIDIHSDGLERERAPRPGAELPIGFALRSFEGKLRAAGITTVFHGAGFEERGSGGLRRSVDAALQLCGAIDEFPSGAVDHRILYRLDVRCPHGLAALRDRLDRVGDRVEHLVSHEDHTPGQGQYADRAYFERYISGTQGLSAQQARETVDQLIADRDDRLDIREQAMSWLGAQALAGRIRLLGHDPATPEEIAELVGRGGTVAEFPTTEAAARAAREQGLPVVMGAPNVLRGASHNGNASGRDLVAQGLVTALASDYLPSGLLTAALLLARDGLATLPAAIRLVTAGPAEVAGLTDRGALRPGLRPDLVLVDTAPRWPSVRTVLIPEFPVPIGAS
ncbi:alpha-D-ribose 1-methylphosphonate 5-triphosphate diphosphatase [Nocardia mangyaensis]|uniref:alpha-D-ribose 1-methylphosphonate 5-triphosphate diphosphatase n=1 Tax=Nocardia mangyaensis TaxID=2213200 RepID=UPI00267448E9|nr:alpha-D-ribose 1-methylphosphonate 5-triphosphate diphosphatase [Nocardia mangyaensis]MDO3649844.1 alpha-D-ribose 1-methylphosphonate 5-triphosphate diphosphatase [Nocardia mangyaensis]